MWPTINEPSRRRFNVNTETTMMYSRRKKTWPVLEENDFLIHKNIRNVTKNICNSIFRMFTCCPLIFSYFLGSFIGIGSSFLFSSYFHSYWLPRNSQVQEFFWQKPTLCPKWTLTPVVDTWNPLETFLFKKSMGTHISLLGVCFCDR